jgi:hypothetical protein
MRLNKVKQQKDIANSDNTKKRMDMALNGSAQTLSYCKFSSTMSTSIVSLSKLSDHSEKRRNFLHMNSMGRTLVS